MDSDLSRLPLPDLVLSAVEQLPPPTPQVTVSAPSSPTRDAAFQFPECSGDENGAAPVPSPRPRPRRRRLASEGGGATMKKGPATDRICKKCCGHLGQAFNESQWASVGANLRNIADDFHASQTKVSRSSDQLGRGGPGYRLDTQIFRIYSTLLEISFLFSFFNIFRSFEFIFLSLDASFFNHNDIYYHFYYRFIIILFFQVYPVVLIHPAYSRATIHSPDTETIRESSGIGSFVSNFSRSNIIAAYPYFQKP